MKTEEKGEIINSNGANFAQNSSVPEPVLSCNRTRMIVGQKKGCRKIDHNTLVRLVKREGLPYHFDPFGSGKWCFLESEISAWFTARMALDQPKPLPGPGRPRKVA